MGSFSYFVGFVLVVLFLSMVLSPVLLFLFLFFLFILFLFLYLVFVFVVSPLISFSTAATYLLTTLSCSTSHDQKIVVLDFTHGIEGAEIFM